VTWLQPVCPPNPSSSCAGSAHGSARLAATLQDIDRSAAAIEHMGNSVTQTSQNTGETMQAVDADVRRFGAETLPELERLLAELNVLSTSLRRLSEQTECAPCGLVFGHTTASGGWTGEPVRAALLSIFSFRKKKNQMKTVRTNKINRPIVGIFSFLQICSVLQTSPLSFLIICSKTKCATDAMF
jgi:hypothetical protein